MILTSELCQAARVLAQIDRPTLSAESGVSDDKIKAFEEGIADLGDETREKLKTTLESLGISFLPEEGEGGVGLRLKFTKSEARRIVDWEGEGGRANQDDVV